MAIYITRAKTTYEFPDFYSKQCPLCGGIFCAVRIGYYYRKKISIQFITLVNVPIPRWLCRRLGHIKPKHRTFSLLPYALIPYHKHDLNLMLETLNYQSRQVKSTLEKTKIFISEKGIETDISLENNQIYDFTQIFNKAYSKLMTIPELKQSIVSLKDFDSSDPVGTVLSFIENYQSPFSTTTRLQASNIEKLSLDFFHNFQSGDQFDRHFLFGTSSQKRC